MSCVQAYKENEQDILTYIPSERNILNSSLNEVRVYGRLLDYGEEMSKIFAPGLNVSLLVNIS